MTINEPFYKSIPIIKQLTEAVEKNAGATQKGDSAWLRYTQRMGSVEERINKLKNANKALSEEITSYQHRINELVAAEEKLSKQRDMGLLSEDAFQKAISPMDRMIESYGKKKRANEGKISSNENVIAQLISNSDITNKLFNMQRGQAALSSISPMLGQLGQFMPELASGVGGLVAAHPALLAAIVAVKTAISTMVNVIKEMIPILNKQTTVNATLGGKYSDEAKKFSNITGASYTDSLDIYSKLGYAGMSAEGASSAASRLAKLSTITGGDISQLMKGFANAVENGSASSIVGMLPGNAMEKKMLSAGMDAQLRAGDIEGVISRLEEFGNKLGATNEALDKVADTTQNKIQRLNNQIDNIKLDVFNRWDNTVNSLIDKFQSITNSGVVKLLFNDFETLGNVVLTIIDIFSGLVDFITTLLSPAFKILADVVGFVSSVIDKLREGINAIINFFKNAVSKLYSFLSNIPIIGKYFTSTNQQGTMSNKLDTLSGGNSMINTRVTNPIMLSDETIDKLSSEAERQYVNQIHIAQTNPQITQNNNYANGAPDANTVAALMMQYLNEYQASAVEGAY